MPHVRVKRDPTPTTDAAYNRMLARYRMDAFVPEFIIFFDKEYTVEMVREEMEWAYERERRGVYFGASDWGEGDPWYEPIG